MTCFSSPLLQTKDFKQNQTQLFQVETWGGKLSEGIVCGLAPKRWIFSWFMYQFWGVSIRFDPLLTDLFLGGRVFAVQGNTFYLIGKQRLVLLKVDKLPPLVTVCTSCFLLLRHGPQAFLNVKLNYSPRSSVMEKIHCGTLALQQQEWRADSLTGIIRLNISNAYCNFWDLTNSFIIPKHAFSMGDHWRVLPSPCLPSEQIIGSGTCWRTKITTMSFHGLTSQHPWN